MRWRASAVAMAVLLGGCSATGSPPQSERAEGATSTTGTAPSTTATPTTIDRTGRKVTWDDVIDVASARHGTVVRSVNAYDRDTGDPLTTDFDVRLQFDGDRGIAEAHIEFPDSPEVPGGGSVDYVFAGDRTLMRSEPVTGRCAGAWLEMGGIIDGRGSDKMGGFAGMVADLGEVRRTPLEPFDRLLALAPVEGAGPADRIVFPVDLPASLLVAGSGRTAAPDHFAELDARAVPAEAILTPTGLRVEERAPLRELIPAEQAGKLPRDADAYDMVGTWELTPSSEPLGLSVPTDVVTTGDSCLDL